MIAVRSKIIFLIVCVFESMYILFAQVLGNTILLLPSLAIFIALAAWASIKGMAIPFLMYFMPFAPLIKLQPGAISFYTIALLVAYIIYIVMGSRNISVVHLVPGLLLIGLILIVKTAYGYSIENYFILFSASILLIPFLSREIDTKYDFYWLTVFFALGIILSATTAQFFASLPSIVRFIGRSTTYGVVRYSGYYGDPNFYSAHITAALGGSLFLLFNNKKKKRIAVIALIIVALLYCGFLSVSKSFFLITICLFLVWGIEFLFRKGKLSAKIMIIMTVIIGIVFLLTSTVFRDLLDSILLRFSGNNTLSALTTGRTDLWVQYIKALFDDPFLFLFGKGFTYVLISDLSSHNTIIQAVFQFGIVGCVFLLLWLLCFIRAFLRDTKISWSSLAQVFILIIGSFGPWLALDLVFFDEFFLIPIYVCVAINYSSKNMSIITSE